MDGQTEARCRMVDTQIRARGIQNPAILEAMRRVLREAFVTPDLEDVSKLWVLIIGSATLNELPDRAKQPKRPTNKVSNKSGVYLKSPKVADAMIEAKLWICDPHRSNASST